MERLVPRHFKDLKMITRPEIDPCRADITHRLFLALKNFATEVGESLEISEGDLFLMVEKPPEAKMGDYALPVFRFAKALKRKPPEIAAALVKGFDNGGETWVERVQATGPFVNIFIRKDRVASWLIPRAIDGTLFRTFAESANRDVNVMVEYSQPNTHKVFHVGHLRNVALGDSLVRLFRYCGYKVNAANYPGDEGAHIAKTLWYMTSRKLKAPNHSQGEWLGEVYSEATRALEETPESEREGVNKELSAILRAIESKSGPLYDLWKETRQWSLDSFNEVYSWLDVRFDTWFFESEISEDAQSIVTEYLNKGVFKEDDGAIGIDLKDAGLGFALMRKRDGNTLYATKDLALAKRKFEQFHIDRSIYVVASEQDFHFRQVFKTLERMGFAQAPKCFHLSYGLVMLPSGKMSSRAGEVITFSRLKSALLEELDREMAKYENEWSAEELASTKHRLSVGAIKYGMLCSDPVKTIVFDIKDWLSFEGNTGPYLMYSYSRTQSILRKATEKGLQPSFERLPALQSEEERDLLRHLYDFNASALTAAEEYKPSHLASHLFNTCKSFNRFYTQHQVLHADSRETAEARLALVAGFGQILKTGLSLLGMTPPERM
jgi:arginyl-tRNA synthetase